MNMNISYIYIRVSTDEQKMGYSPDNQLRQCKEYAKMHNYKIAKVFDDSGRSGRNAITRPELQNLLKLIEEKPPEAIIIYKIDRFARNVNDFTGIYNKLKSKGIKLLSVNEGDLMEGSSLIPNIFASVAQWESEVNSQRTRDALTQKFIDGWQPNLLYIGYRSIGQEKEKKTCEPNPFMAPTIKQLFELYATGNYSIVEIQDWLSDKNILSKNGTVVSHSVINGILRNPFYYGLIRWHGQSKTGKHKPIITKELFDTCQYVLAKHRSFITRKRKYDYLLRGFLSCFYCGQRYTAEPHPNHSVTNPTIIHYYHCPKRDRNGCPSEYIEATKLETLVEKEIGKMEFTQTFIDSVVTTTKKVIEENRKNINSDRQGFINQKMALETKRNTLEDALLDNVIDRDAYKRKHSEIEGKIIDLEGKIQEIENKARVDIGLIEEVLAFTRNIHKGYLEAPQFLKKYYLRFFFEKIVVKDRKIYKAIPTPIFAVLKNRHEIIIRRSELRG